MPDQHWEVRGPAQGSPAVEAWSRDYIRFDHRPPWQQRLRNEIRSGCQELRSSTGQVLHAKIHGVKRANTDVENLLIYNIGTSAFNNAGRNGVRFEHGDAVPAAPSGTSDYAFYYRYALTPSMDRTTFANWREERQLASFDWVDLGKFAGERKLAQVWLALARGNTMPLFPAIEHGAAYAVRVEVRPPLGKEPTLASLVKGIFDGVICAFQAHTDETVLPTVAKRLAECFSATSEEIVRLLLDQSRAVLGTESRLVAPYRSGVKWYPADHLCVAGELLTGEPINDCWAIKGEVTQLARR